MIKKLLAWLDKIGADQITFRKVGKGIGAHLNIQVEELNNFNQNGYVTVDEALLLDTTLYAGEMDEAVFHQLKNNYYYGMNDKSEFNEECCPNCGAQAGDYEETLMGGKLDRNKRTCLRCRCTWFGYEMTAEMVTKYIKDN